MTLLASRSGQVVTRAEIQKEIWSDSVVDFEQGLNFCIRQIRAALGDDPGSPRFIETIPRRGYRFLVAVTSNDRMPAPSVPEAPSLTQRAAVEVPRTWRWGAAAVLLAVGVLATWYFRPQAAPPLWRGDPLTTYLGFQRHPALSPDGNQVAFSWDGEKQDNFDIYVKLIGPGRPVRLTTNPAEDVSPAWSPDGRTIAFLRRLGGDRNDLLLIPALGGPERKFTETRKGGWSAGGAVPRRGDRP